MLNETNWPEMADFKDIPARTGSPNLPLALAGIDEVCDHCKEKMLQAQTLEMERRIQEMLPKGSPMETALQDAVRRDFVRYAESKGVTL